MRQQPPHSSSFFVALSVLLIAGCAKPQNISEKTPVKNPPSAQQLVDSWGGGKENKGAWELNRHWVGTLKAVVTTGQYQSEGWKAQCADVPIRFNTRLNRSHPEGTKQSPPILIAMSKTGSFSHSAVYRQILPAIEDLRAQDKITAILASFGKQHGWTDGWGGENEMHWTEGWQWFTHAGENQIRVLHVFAHVSQAKGKS